jgi:cobalamin biosynthesis Mg chelatase CobN
VTTPTQTQTNTVVKTQTVTTPTTTTQTSTSHAPAAAAVGAAAAASKEPSSESSGLPGWAWALIGAAVVGAAIGIITLIRRGRKDSSPSDGTGGPKASGGEPRPPSTPPLV